MRAIIFAIIVSCVTSFMNTKILTLKNHLKLNMVELSSRKQLFFDIVESGLNDRYSKTEASRVLDFVSYAKREKGLPATIDRIAGHDPCEEYIDGLAAQPWWETTSFEWVGKLEAKSPQIRNELVQVLTKDAQTFKGDSRYQQTMGTGWSAFRLQRLGEWNAENMLRFPETTEIIKSLNIPLAVRGVMFAKQDPGSGVQPHSDGRNFILTLHLGLTVPKNGCWIQVGKDRREWKQDKAIIFDTSFTHSTGNESDEDRYVLIIDFWHPGLTTVECDALEFIYDSRNKFETGRADEIECTYVKSGKTLNEDEYARNQQTFMKTLGDIFGDGGLIKFNKGVRR